MSKLSKDDIKKHTIALKLLEKDILTYEDKKYVYENWHEGAESMNSKFGAFFTPFDLAKDFNLEIIKGNNRKIVDLCAGIGMLSFLAYHHCSEDERPEITCVELNYDYIEVGKKLLPEATWIHGSVMDKGLIENLGHLTKQ